MARTKRARLSFSYDQEADVLYVAVGRAQHAIGELRENGVVIRRHPKTHHIVGFTIIDFTRHFATHHAKPITTPVSAVLQPV